MLRPLPCRRGSLPRVRVREAQNGERKTMTELGTLPDEEALESTACESARALERALLGLCSAAGVEACGRARRPASAAARRELSPIARLTPRLASNPEPEGRLIKSGSSMTRSCQSQGAPGGRGGEAGLQAERLYSHRNRGCSRRQATWPQQPPPPAKNPVRTSLTHTSGAVPAKDARRSEVGDAGRPLLGCRRSDRVRAGRACEARVFPARPSAHASERTQPAVEQVDSGVKAALSRSFGAPLRLSQPWRRLPRHTPTADVPKPLWHAVACDSALGRANAQTPAESPCCPIECLRGNSAG